MNGNDLKYFINHTIKITLVDGKNLKGKLTYIENDHSISGETELVLNFKTGYLTIPLYEIDYIKVM